MLYKDIFESQGDSMYDPENDQTAYKITDTRKPKLTLEVINKLRMYRKFKENEDARRDIVVSTVYAPVPDDSQM